MADCESCKTKEKSSWVVQKVVAFEYGSGRCLRELFITKVKSQFKWSSTKNQVVTRAAVAYERGHKEGFDCNFFRLLDKKCELLMSS